MSIDGHDPSDITKPEIYDPPQPESAEEWVEWHEGENARLRTLIVYLRVLLELGEHAFVDFSEPQMEDAWDIVIQESLKQQEAVA